MLTASLGDRPFLPAGTVVLGGVPEGMKFAFRKWDARNVSTAKEFKVMSVDAALAAFQDDRA